MSLNQNEWEVFFDRHAPRYMENVFTKNTLEEVEFILDEIKLPKGSRILDIGCGTGRHSIELARRGYKMTGVDISRGMLDEAQNKANELGVTLELVHSDALAYRAENEFDAAICLCEGAFGLLGLRDDPYQHDLEILKNIHGALKPNGMLILTALNGLRKIREATEESITEGRFDPLTLMEIFSINPDESGRNELVTVRERAFVPSELALMLHVTGFQVIRVWGGTAGGWKRKPVELDEMEIMVIARKGDSQEK